MFHIIFFDKGGRTKICKLRPASSIILTRDLNTIIQQQGQFSFGSATVGHTRLELDPFQPFLHSSPKYFFVSMNISKQLFQPYIKSFFHSKLSYLIFYTSLTVAFCFVIQIICVRVFLSPHVFNTLIWFSFQAHVFGFMKENLHTKQK